MDCVMDYLVVFLVVNCLLLHLIGYVFFALLMYKIKAKRIQSSKPQVRIGKVTR